MSNPLLESLRTLLEEELDGVTLTPEGLRAVIDARFGEVTVRVDPEDNSDGMDTVALRVQVLVAPPAGAGPDFLVWALATNVQFWGVKIGFAEDGMLAVHADVEVDDDVVHESVAAEIMDRTESIIQLLDEDMTEFCVAANIGTPAQRVRWASRQPGGAPGDDD